MSLGNCMFFCSFDLESGFHQIEVYPNDKFKTAFITRDGVYQWKSMPFGLVNAPFAFQKMLNHIFKKYLWKFIIVYMDDILIYSKSKNEHLNHLRVVFEILKELGFKLKPSKTKVFKNEIEFLGFCFKTNSISIPLKQKMKLL